MPNTDFTTKLLELEDVIISDLQTTNTEVHVYFTLKRKVHVCPHCGHIPIKYMITVLLLLKIFLLWARKLSFIIGNVGIIVRIVANIFMNLSLFFQNIVVSPREWLFMQFIYYMPIRVFVQLLLLLVAPIPFFFVEYRIFLIQNLLPCLLFYL